MSEVKEIKQTKMMCRISGVLSEKALELKSGELKGDNGKTIPCEIIQGTISVETDNGVFPLRVYCASKTKKDGGKENVMFKGIKTIMDSYISKVDAAKDDSLTADKINCNVKVSINDYVANDGSVKTSVQLSLNSARRATGDFESVTDVDMDGYIRSIKPETKGDDEETGRLMVEFVTIGYGGKAEPYTLYVPEELADDFEDIYEPSQTVEMYCSLVMRHIGEKKTSTAKFGRKANVSSGYDVMEMIVVGAEDPYEEPDDDEIESKVIDKKTIKKLMEERSLMLEELPKQKKEKDKDKKSTKTDKGLGRKNKVVEEEDETDDDYDIF